MSLFEETKRKVSPGAGLWSTAAACAGELRSRAEGDGGFWAWSHHLPTSQKFHVGSQIRGSPQSDGSFLPLLTLLWGCLGSWVFYFWVANCKTAKLNKGWRLLWVAA